MSVILSSGGGSYTLPMAVLGFLVSDSTVPDTQQVVSKYWTMWSPWLTLGCHLSPFSTVFSLSLCETIWSAAGDGTGKSLKNYGSVYVFVCLSVYVRVCMCICLSLCVMQMCVSVYVCCTYVCVHVCLYKCICTCVHVCVCLCVHVARMCVHIYVCLSVYMCVHTCVYFQGVWTC